MTANQIVRVIPVLKVNNRNVNQRFYEETLGMKVLVEEGALLSLGDASKVEKIVLEESPSMRSRKVEGSKKLGRIVVKVAQAQEIDYLLARQPETSALYQGANGRAFEVVSPQGDTIFVHAEENLESLEPLEKAPLVEAPEDFKGLTTLRWSFLRSTWLILLSLRSSIATCSFGTPYPFTGSPRRRSPSGKPCDLGFEYDQGRIGSF